jgi:multisubunit Na+/H+ antiporter MnhB subunit
MVNEGHAGRLKRLSLAALGLVSILIFAGLAFAILALPQIADGLANEVNAELARSGIGNPVTATLLDFRSYDTLLEMAVLLLAVVAIRTLPRGKLAAMRPDDEILTFLSRALVPIMILIAGYLLMAGIDGAGGAFQAGAILAACGVLLMLSGERLPLSDDSLPVRLGLAVGLAAFVATGVAGMMVANAFLDYPEGGASGIALLLELGVTVSVALALLDLFAGVLRRASGGHTPRATRREEQ